MSFVLPDFDLASPTYADFRKALKSNGIAVVHDEEKSGFLGFYYNDLYGGFTNEKAHYAHVPLYFYDDETDELDNRVPFDAMYQTIFQHICRVLGFEPHELGTFRCPHNTELEIYYFAVWNLRNCRLALLQNEYDIQFGLDVSLRFLYRDGDVFAMLYGND